MVYKKQNYLGFSQIVDLVIDRILLGEYPEEEKIPSVREMAEVLEVSPNTIVRAYEKLDIAELIYTQRGLGFFVRSGAKEKVRKIRLKELEEVELPRVVRKCYVLGLKTEEVLALIKNIK